MPVSVGPWTGEETSAGLEWYREGRGEWVGCELARVAVTPGALHVRARKPTPIGQGPYKHFDATVFPPEQLQGAMMWADRHLLAQGYSLEGGLSLQVDRASVRAAIVAWDQLVRSRS